MCLDNGVRLGMNPNDALLHPLYLQQCIQSTLQVENLLLQQVICNDFTTESMATCNNTMQCAIQLH